MLLTPALDKVITKKHTTSTIQISNKYITNIIVILRVNNVMVTCLFVSLNLYYIIVCTWLIGKLIYKFFYFVNLFYASVGWINTSVSD